MDFTLGFGGPSCLEVGRSGSCLQVGSLCGASGEAQGANDDKHDNCDDTASPGSGLLNNNERTNERTNKIMHV